MQSERYSASQRRWRSFGPCIEGRVIGAGLRRARFGGADGTTCLPCEVMLIKSRTDNELRRMGRSCTSATNEESRSQRRRHAFDKFEAKLETLKGRYSYGVIVEGDHRASVALARMMISHPTWVIPEESLSSSPTENSNAYETARAQRFQRDGPLHRVLSRPARAAALAPMR